MRILVTGSTGYIGRSPVPRFAPRGLCGRLCWYLLYPFHASIFGGMARGVAVRAAAERA